MNLSSSKLFVFILLSILITSCGDDDFKKYAALSELRVLGIVSDIPEVSDTNETVSLTPIVSDVKNEGRVISIKVEGCVDPGIATGEEIRCVGGDKYQLVSNSTVNLNTELGATVYTGNLAAVDVTIPADILDGRSALEQYNGVDYLVLFTFSVDEEEIISFKRIRVSSRPIKNTNPTIDSISNLAMVATEQTLSVTLGDSPEDFNFYNLTGEIEQGKEVYYLSWFTSSGEIENSQVYASESTKLSLASTLPSEAVVVVMLRDGRGGSSFLVQKIP